MQTILHFQFNGQSLNLQQLFKCIAIPRALIDEHFGFHFDTFNLSMGCNPRHIVCPDIDRFVKYRNRFH